MIGDIDRRIARALGRIRLAFRVVLGNTDSAPGIQLSAGDGLAGEKLEAAELMQQFGFSSVPPIGTQGIVIPLGGKTSHGVIIATEHAIYRIAGLESGESVLYNQFGQAVYLTRDGVVIDGGDKPVTIKNAPKVRAEVARLECTGDIIDNCDSGGRSMSNMRDAYDRHTHKENDIGGHTETPSIMMGEK